MFWIRKKIRLKAYAVRVTLRTEPFLVTDLFGISLCNGWCHIILTACSQEEDPGGGIPAAMSSWQWL